MENAVRRDTDEQPFGEDKAMLYATVAIVAGSVLVLFLLAVGFRNYVMS